MKDVKKEKEALAESWFDDFPLFCREALGESMFPRPFHSLHVKMFKALLAPARKKLILAPRGIGKTTLARALVIRALLMREKHFIVYISNSLTVAEMQTENIKRELIGNSILKKVFGDIRSAIDNPDFDDDSFSKKAWVAFGSVLVLPRGLNQQIRGLNWASFRPDLVVFDDPEDAEEIWNEELRKKFRRWVLGDVMAVGSRYNKDVEFVYIDTLKHFDAFPVHLMKLKDWYCVRLAVCDESGKSLAPEFMSDEEVAAEMASYEELGELDTFYREYMNIPLAPAKASFKREFFHHYDERALRPQDLAHMENVLLIDPAKSVTPQSDESAMVMVGVNVVSGKLKVRDIFHGRVYPDQLYDMAFELCARYNCHIIGYEVTSLNEFITYPFKNEATRRGLDHFEFIELRPRGREKGDRIKSLVPLYRKGLIDHNAVVCQELELQLLQFPVSVHDDIMDALAYIVPMLDEGGRYFMPKPKLGHAYDPELEYNGTMDDPALEYMEYLA